MKNVSLTILTVLLAITVFLAYTAMQKYMRQQAIDDCLHAGIAKFTNEAGQDVEVPDGYWYDFCMKEKGINNK